MKQAWKLHKDAFTDALVYMQGRMRGTIKSLRTPWSKWNDASVDGFEWHNTIIIAGRPGSGKTLIKDQIIRESFTINPGEDFRVLEFQLEMLGRTSAIREYTSVIGKSYKHLCSAGSMLTDKELQICYEYAKKRVEYPVDIVEDAPTVEEFIEIVENYMNTYAATDATGKKVYKKTIITIDHSLLLKKSYYHKETSDMLYTLGEALTMLKRKYPIIFIVLSQLNRNIDRPERNEDGKYGNYVLESDVFGADALLQHADMLVGLNRPGKQKIKYYGPDRFIIADDSVLVAHFLKCRNGDVRMSFFRAQFSTMQIAEMDTPPTKQPLQL